MATVQCISNLSPPSHLPSPDWSDLRYRTSVASYLVDGVYKLAVCGPDDRSQAKPWWEDLDFTLVETLTAECDLSTYGAIFEYNNYNKYQNTSGLRPPRFVIAFRGTILRSHTLICDVKSCLRCIFDTLHDNQTAMLAMEATDKMVAEHGDTSIWLAGHSLGAARALMVGKNMARRRFLLEAHIFNPPISAFPLEQLLNSEKLKDAIRVAKSLVKAGVASLLKGTQVQEDEQSMNLASWKPYLYVNRKDPICSEYIGHFKNKRVMSTMGLRRAEQIATENPLRSLLFENRGTSSASDFPKESLHLIPTAFMIVNMKVTCGLDEAHGLEQWRDPSFEGECSFYQS